MIASSNILMRSGELENCSLLLAALLAAALCRRGAIMGAKRSITSGAIAWDCSWL